MNRGLFFRLVSHHDKEAALAEAIAGIRQGSNVPVTVHRVDPASFRKIPGAPFAYWVSERVRRLFTELPPFEGNGRTVKQGLATADDFRFVRAWWEVPPHKILTGTPDTTPEEFRRVTFEGKRWVPFAKGGAYSPYYTDFHLAVNWERDGAEMRDFERAVIRNDDFYFRPGLTWPLRGIRLSAQAVPKGSMFSVAGKLATSVRIEDLPILLGLMNSKPFDYMVGVFAGKVGGVQYEVGLIGRIPIPPVPSPEPLGEDVAEAWQIRSHTTCHDERSHLFSLPALFQVGGRTLDERTACWGRRVGAFEETLLGWRRKIDDTAFRLYGLESDERRRIEDWLESGAQVAMPEEMSEGLPEEEEDDGGPEPVEDRQHLVSDMLSYAVGSAFGRWDVRLATEKRGVPALPGPFDPLPVCSPGMLTGLDGLPLREAPPRYPLRIAPDGILVDDPGPEGKSPHQDDIVRHVRQVLELLWGERLEAIEREGCDILGVKELRGYFRNPRSFFEDHIKRHKKSKPTAPIYWLLQSGKRSFGLWLYYHRLDKDTLFKAIQHYVEPKIRGEMARLREMTAQLEAGKDTLPRREVTRLEKAMDRQQDLLTELTAFRDALQRVVDIGYDPDLDDGVVLNIAPLHQVVPWKEAKKYWDELCAGKYPWSTISRHLKSKGLVSR